MNRSLALARTFLGQMVTVTIDRPRGSHHPRHGHLYPVNYGYLPGTRAPDGEALDAYVLGAGRLQAFRVELSRSFTAPMTSWWLCPKVWC